MGFARIMAWLGITAIVAQLAGCGVSTAKPRAQASVAEFHRMLNAHDYNFIWNTADDDFKESFSHEDFEKFMGAIERKLGRVIKSANAGWQVRSQNLTTYTVLAQSTLFERGRATETFTFIDADGHTRLIGYNVNSLALISQ